jgi:hypothetical protein
LDLLLSVINVSVQTVEIVEKLPEVRFEAWIYSDWKVSNLPIAFVPFGVYRNTGK